MRKITLFGFFDFGELNIGGGVQKSRNYADILRHKYGDENIVCIDRAQLSKNPMQVFFSLVKSMKKSQLVIIMISTPKMLKLVLPFFLLGKKIFSYRLVYTVLGGWLPSLCEKDLSLCRKLNKLDRIFVETHSMVNLLSMLNNVERQANFSLKKPLSSLNVYNINEKKTFNFCTFSRVTKEKGILDAINTISEVNKRYGYNICTLSIYGQVWDDFVEEFSQCVKEHSDFVEYKGVLGSDDAIDTLAEYYMLLFPTFYQGEGFPGTLVESFMAGLPSISSDWKYNSEIVINEETGLIYNLETDSLIDKIIFSIENVAIINRMRYRCIEEAKKYCPDVVMENVYNLIVED